MVKQRTSSVTLQCPDCSGTGWIDGPRGRNFCPTCHGALVYRCANGRWLGWKKPLSRILFLEERIERTVRATISGALLAFGIIGVVFGVLAFQKALSFSTVEYSLQGILQFLWEVLTLPDPWMFVFWLSFLGDLYLFYRFEQRQHLEAPVLPPVRIDETPLVVEFSALTSRQVVDVSRSFTRTSQMVVEHAFELAARFRHAAIEPTHLLAAAAGDSDVALALLRLGITLNPLRDRLRRALARLPTIPEEPRFGTAAAKVLVRAYERAQSLHLLQVTTPHILEALSIEPSVAQDILFDLNANEEKVHNVALWALMQRRLFQSWSRLRSRALNKPKSGMDRAMTAAATPVLENFSTDLTQHARRGTLPLILDRERETEDVFRVVESGRHNVILVGEKGVGTTSLLQALAERMAAEDVPEVLQDKRLVQLSVSQLVSGAGGTGELENRLQEIILEIVRAGNVVLAIEDIHELVGVSSVSGQSLDLASILSKVLESRRFVALATTTLEGYRQYIEPSALFTTFEKVDIQEVTPEVAIQILESKAGAVEARHKVFFSYLAIEKIVNMSIRYIHDRRLPEKALTLLEEVAAYTRAAKGANAAVSAEDAAAVISRRTNVNVAAVTTDEATKLLQLEQRMHERMVGQDHAVQAVANALRRSRAELRDPKRPVAVFLFLGPTGVGKTELAKTVAETYFGDEQNMIRLDMSEYQEPSSLARLLGAAPGYGGATAGGYLTEAVRKNPFSLILLDELEKAHPDVLNVFLQVFDDGRLTDSNGRTVDFTNAIIIATSNAGTDVIQQRMKEGQGIDRIRTELIENVLGRYFRPEFLNRFDEIIVFAPLQQEEIMKIAGLLIGKIAQQLANRGIVLRATPEAVRELAVAGFDPIFGARPLRRVLQERVDNALATYLLTGKLGRRDVAVLEPGGVIRVEPAKEL
ncbi:MAG: ATP-dependent Clp protease ATP-binding subunit [Candidatus Kerfeldbacteria bacterium]|nr:ATP-dependent Clp protease ATP-binding subunit [Candidatus Kerfeldbacteria bacterium]